MILVDSNEPLELELLLAQSIETERGNINQLPGQTRIYPDYVLVNGKVIGVNRKQAGELVGALPQAEEQLQRELASPVEGLCLLVEGIITPTSKGECQTWKLSKKGDLLFRNQQYRHPYKALQAWFYRLWEIGIPVLLSPSLEASAILLVGLHDNIGKAEEEHKTFKRLVKEEYWVTEVDAPKRDMALTLMGIRNGGCGEEIALALADRFSDLTQLIQYMAPPEDMTGGGGSIADIKLASGRRIGPAKEKQLRRALGL